MFCFDPAAPLSQSTEVNLCQEPFLAHTRQYLATHPAVHVDISHIGHNDVEIMMRVCRLNGVPCELLTPDRRAELRGIARQRREQAAAPSTQ